MMAGLAIGIALACRDRRVAIRLVIALGVTFAFATAVGDRRAALRDPPSHLGPARPIA